MKDLSATILAAAIKQREQDAPYVRLIEVTLPTTPKVVYRIANFDRAVSFDQTSAGAALTYSPFPVAVGDFTDTKSGDLPQVQVGISNVTRELSTNVDQYLGLTGETVRILTVNGAALGDNQARLLFVGKIIACEADEKTILFTLGQPSLTRAAFPARRYLTKCSVVRFGDADCGYPIPGSPTNAIGGGFDFCPRTVSACKDRGLDEVARGLVQLHTKRFDGFPGIAPGNE